ncbi:MAG: hypothetical protein HYT44_03515 [Nitrosarchaeum sp.]|nr:hypothetical protein [Nitrosarchaeum sp.]
MRFPNISCKIEILSSINSSEDPKKIETAILNIFPDAKIKIDNFSIKNLENDSTWFYLNKQAAFSNAIALCEEAEESPLGPIKVILTSSNIDRIIDWLILRN